MNSWRVLLKLFYQFYSYSKFVHQPFHRFGFDVCPVLRNFLVTSPRKIACNKFKRFGWPAKVFFNWRWLIRSLIYKNLLFSSCIFSLVTFFTHTDIFFITSSFHGSIITATLFLDIVCDYSLWLFCQCRCSTVSGRNPRSLYIWNVMYRDIVAFSFDYPAEYRAEPALSQIRFWISIVDAYNDRS